MQANSWHLIIPLSCVLLSLEYLESKEKVAKIWISQEQKEIFRLNEKHFSKFLKGNHLVKT